MWPFSTTSGCSGHHYGTYKKQWHGATLNRVGPTIRSGIDNRMVIVEPQEYACCQHDGCSETTTRSSRTDYAIPLDCLSTINESERLEFMHEAAELYDELDDSEDINDYRLRLLDLMESDDE